MDLPEARALAEKCLSDTATDEQPLQLVDDSLVADLGWAFVLAWNTARYFDTRRAKDAAGPGPGPIVVVKSTRTAFFLSSTPSFDDQLSRYADTMGFPPPPALGW